MNLLNLLYPTIRILALVMTFVSFVYLLRWFCEFLYARFLSVAFYNNGIWVENNPQAQEFNQFLTRHTLVSNLSFRKVLVWSVAFSASFFTFIASGVIYAAL